ncbi:transposase [Streptomyces sp. NPDC056987]|uniref:IS110 family transposase n=1 Tax=Streptomyces sp. NPDC056987 TaxID=3345988 RepID=UPI00362D4721
MNAEPTPVIGGIDTHTDFHQLAVIDTVGRHLATKSFPTTPDGYHGLLRWLRTHREVLAVGMESTGHYGPNSPASCTSTTSRSSRSTGPAGAPATSTARPTPWTPTPPQPPFCPAVPKAPPESHNGTVESIRVLRMARISAIKARTQAINQIRALIITAPSEVRELTTGKLIKALARTRPAGDPADPAHAARITLRDWPAATWR